MRQLLAPLMILALSLPLAAEETPAVSNTVPAPPPQRIEIQVPAFSVRLYAGDERIRDYRCRVGKTTTPTRTGEGYVSARFRPTVFRYDKGEKAGEIITHSRIRRYHNGPVMKTIRIPYDERIRGLELRIDGRVSGQIIHSTTNPETVGHVYSSGCLGLYEDDMLELFERTPKGTTVSIRYDLVEFDGRSFFFHRDIYRRKQNPQEQLRKLLDGLGLAASPGLEEALLAEGLSRGTVPLADFLRDYKRDWL